MTTDCHPWTRCDQLESQRQCSHRPEQATITVDDVDTATGETLYLADCQDCEALIRTGYTTVERPEYADWVVFE